MPVIDQIRERQGEINTVWGAFANLGPEAEYCFLNQIICLHKAEEQHAASLPNAPAGRRKVLLPAVHELTHWLDHVSTTWGRKNLLSVYNAFHARVANSEYGFHHIATAFESIHRIRSYHYYRVIGKNADVLKAIRPWAWDTSCGARYSSSGHVREDDPLLFIRFFIAPSFNENSLVARVPLSPLTMTEVNAVAAEQAWTRREATREQGTAFDPDSWHQQAFGTLYEPEFIDYNAALHCVANHTEVYDIESAYPYARALATLALNLPSRYFQKLKIPSSQRIHWPKPRIERMRAAIDPSFAFLVFCAHSVPSSGSAPGDWIESVLRAAGLPELQAIQQVWLNELSRPSQFVDGPHRGRLLAHLEAGRRWAAERGILGEPSVLLDVMDGVRELPLPAMLLGDATSLQLGTPAIPAADSAADLVGWHETTWKLEHQLREFLAACGRVTQFP